MAFFWPCSPCCGGCQVDDGKPRTDPANEGTWVPSGTWRGAGGVTWSFTANPGDDSGETWFFYGSESTSKAGGGATFSEQRDWMNLCNWYSNKTTSPSSSANLTTVLDKRATRIPDESAVVHIYSIVATNTPAKTVKHAYFWGDAMLLTLPTAATELTTTSPAHDSIYGSVFNNATSVGAGATPFIILNGGATFNEDSFNYGTVNGGAVFNGSSFNLVTINGGAVFNDNSENNSGAVNGGATFNDNSKNDTIFALVNGGAVFNDNSENNSGTVNGGATFNDNSCTRRTTGNFFATPCTRKFVAHPTDLPICNGSAPNGCAAGGNTCGCG